ncbi:MAG: hypothetical protein RLZZ422_18 [Pseudomonadota bacterium]|jgi:DNA-binding XRE family transcriptional regulator
MMSDIHDIRPKRRAHASCGQDPMLLELGDKVRASRCAIGMTQEELALVAGVGRELVIQLENGKPGVSLGKASLILTTLGQRLLVAGR